MGDPRNHVAFYCAAKLTFEGVPLELRFNFDDTSILVCADARSGTNKCLGLAWTTEDIMKILKKCNRSPGAQSRNPDCTPRMVQWGCLASACGRFHLLIYKMYDRAISAENNLKWFKLSQQTNGCDIIILFVRGKQLGPGAVEIEAKPLSEGPISEEQAAETLLQQIDHGGLDHKHPSEKEVAEVVLTLVAKKIAEVKLKFYENIGTGFQTGRKFTAINASNAKEIREAVAAVEEEKFSSQDISDDQSGAVAEEKELSSQHQDPLDCAAGDFCPVQNNNIVGLCPAHKFCPHAVATVTSKRNNAECVSSIKSLAMAIGAKHCSMCNHCYVNWGYHIRTPEHVSALQGVMQEQDKGQVATLLLPDLLDFGDGNSDDELITIPALISDCTDDDDDGSDFDAHDFELGNFQDQIETEVSDCCPHLPDVIDGKFHRHEILKNIVSQAPYMCSICFRPGQGPFYCCNLCAFYAHPSCCLDKNSAVHAKSSTAHVVQEIAAAIIDGHEDVSRRAAMSLDGAVGQSLALEGTAKNPGIIEREFLPIGCGVAKGSAMCSLSQNPLDLMRSFMSIKRAKLKWTEKSGRPSTSMQMFIDSEFKTIMHKVSATDKRTFILALSHVEHTISKHFHMDALQSGWEKAGLIDLNFHTIMGHWLEWQNMKPENVTGVQNLLPTFLHEMATKHELSDQTMAMMQPYFPVDFKVYPTGRETLSMPRKRATIFSRWVELKRKIAEKAERETELLAHNAGEEVRPQNPPTDGKGKAICPCAYNGFRGRHYTDTDEGWSIHKLTKGHINWRDAQSQDNERSSRQETAAMLPWFQQEDCILVKTGMERINLSATLGKHFVKAKITDADIPMMLFMTEDRWMQEFFMQPGQVRVIKESFRTSSVAANKLVQVEFETILEWFGSYDQPFDEQQFCDDEHEFFECQNDCRRAMAPLLNSCRESMLRYNDFVFGASAEPQAAAGIEGESDDDAEGKEAAKRRAKRLRADRKQGRR
jgi:hypothetical protein